MSFKIGIVGAARRHQGTGPYIARAFNQLGHDIVGIIGTTRATALEASTHLDQQYGIKTQGYTCLEALTITSTSTKRVPQVFLSVLFLCRVTHKT